MDKDFVWARLDKNTAAAVVAAAVADSNVAAAARSVHPDAPADK